MPLEFLTLELIFHTGTSNKMADNSLSLDIFGQYTSLEHEATDMEFCIIQDAFQDVAKKSQKFQSTFQSPVIFDKLFYINPL